MMVSVIMLRAIMLSVIMLSVLRLSVIMIWKYVTFAYKEDTWVQNKSMFITEVLLQAI